MKHTISKICRTSYQCLTIIATTKSIKTSSRRDPVGHHHIISVVAEIIQTGGICTHSSTSMKDEHGDTFVPPPSRFLFCIVVIFPTREMMGNSQRVPTSQRAAIRFSFFSFFCLLIFIPFCKVVRVIIPIRLPRRPSSGQPVVGNTRPRHKKEPGNPGRMGTLIPCLCHRSQNVFSASKTLDILLDNEQVVSIYKERIFIPPPRSITECCGV